ncbi:hypothetical protein K470DRAFT_53958 [Piedraia hortae CBS 480.64]|uniref:Uncharacterized protein n=1 Tax=Piedraia hortae CBS 480.64 TaxID=1314780 RepID=A0A6A7CCG3_9PEZI|nr:hypothetical protein K470DRAFT_53958 [Piedraia hortae CBS 480.64]
MLEEDGKTATASRRLAQKICAMTSRQTAQGEEQDEEEEAGAGFRDKGEEGEVKVEAARLSTSALDSNYSYFMPRLGRSQSVTSTPPASASDVTATAQLVSHTDQLSIQNARLNSLAPVMESDSVAVVSPDPNEAVELERSLVYPNQSHAALHSQHHPTRSGVHRQMSSHPVGCTNR